MRSNGKPTKPAGPPVKKKKRRMSLRKKILISASIAVGFTALATGGIIFVLTTANFNPAKLDQGATSPTIVYDRYGHVAFTISPSGVRRVKLSQIPKMLQDALIATEDIRFYQNHGFDLRSTFRSLVQDILHRGTLQGASTITEQLAKMVYLTDNQSIKYKIQEIILGIEISRYYTKNQILDMYFNTANFNGATPGIENAAQIYFQKNVWQLNLPQCALLAGLPQAPTQYDPFLHPHAAMARRNIVLGQLLKYHFISHATYTKAIHSPLDLAKNPGVVADGVPPQYASYRDYLYEEANKIGIGARALQQGGYKIYTNLSPQLQMAAYQQFNNNAYFPPNMNGNVAQGGAAFLDPKTGGLLAIMGSRPSTYQYEGFDYATQTQRSPGSSIKPLVVYGPAIDTGKYNADSLLYDGPLNIGGYQPQDWESHPTINEHVTMRDALAMSWNIPAVWLLQQIGITTGLTFAERAGLHFQPQDFMHLDVALGDIHPGTNPLQMAEAYSAFDNNGQRIPAHAIERIVNAQGLTVYQAQSVPIQVMKPSTASQIVGLLQNNVVNGIAHLAGVAGRHVAGKTGSVAYLPPGYTYSPGDSDLWFCGFTPNVVGAIWEGFPNTSLQAYIPNWVGGSALPAELFSAIMTQGLAGTPAGSFTTPVNSSSTAPLMTLTGLTGSYSASQQGVSLSWNPLNGPVYYLVFRGGPSDRNLYYNRSIGKVTSPSYVDPIHVIGGHTYQVVAFNALTDHEIAVSPEIEVQITSSSLVGTGNTPPSSGSGTTAPGSGTTTTPSGSGTTTPGSGTTTTPSGSGTTAPGSGTTTTPSGSGTTTSGTGPASTVIPGTSTPAAPPAGALKPPPQGE
ncbi:hypothetical protein ATW55_08905 [Ferroacidibacillus organovorans]|uniref:Uncharacterized protein n=2 Tax=Ferroacidibacillus organovorans TaxID=1765683 RepID=A0A117SYG0_9BACL|nr:hypothetical protein ATW55_08905 [Ferroacidibacillus organovorans]